MEKPVKLKNTNSQSWKALFKTIKKLRLPWLWIIIGLSLNFSLETLLLKLPDTTADLLSGTLSKSAVWGAVMYYVSFGLLSFLCVAGQVQAQSYGVKKTRDSVWKKMLNMQMSFFDKNDPSDLISAITTDASSAIIDFINVIIYLFPCIYYVTMALIKINGYHWLLAASCFALLPLKYIYALLMGKQFQKSSYRLYDRIGMLTGYLADRIKNLPLIKTYTNENSETKNGMNTAKEIYKVNMKIVHLENISSAAIAVMEILQKFIVVVIAVILLQQKKIDIATWLAFFLFTQNLFSYMDQIFDSWIRIKGMHGSFQRIVSIMEGEDEKKSGIENFPQKSDIRFENVTFIYPETDIPALNNVSFTVPNGTSAAIVGLCGSGKTTSVNLLERFYCPNSGDIFIGDTNIKNLSLLTLRKNLSYVQQGAEIFEGTLRETLTYGIERTVTDAEILTAAEKTGFDEYLNSCKNGLDSETILDSNSISGGQKQRLVLTRQLLRNSNIIIMDEPTSALDVQISSKIQDITLSLFKEKTGIVITHDLDFAKKCDKILVMHKGKLVGEGTHNDLIKNCDAYISINNTAKEGAAL